MFVGLAHETFSYHLTLSESLLKILFYKKSIIKTKQIDPTQPKFVSVQQQIQQQKNAWC